MTDSLGSSTFLGGKVSRQVLRQAYRAARKAEASAAKPQPKPRPRNRRRRK